MNQILNLNYEETEQKAKALIDAITGGKTSE